jgi:hypothetical protein
MPSKVDLTETGITFPGTRFAHHAGQRNQVAQAASPSTPATNTKDEPPSEELRHTNFLMIKSGTSRMSSLARPVSDCDMLFSEAS